jgi:hypothetical protein
MATDSIVLPLLWTGGWVYIGCQMLGRNCVVLSSYQSLHCTSQPYLDTVLTALIFLQCLRPTEMAENAVIKNFQSVHSL